MFQELLIFLTLTHQNLERHAAFVSAISPKESEIIVKGKKHIEDILTYVDCDIVLIEGFKEEKTFPKIVCVLQPDDEKKVM